MKVMKKTLVAMFAIMLLAACGTTTGPGNKAPADDNIEQQNFRGNDVDNNRDNRNDNFDNNQFNDRNDNNLNRRQMKDNNDLQPDKNDMNNDIMEDENLVR